FLTLYLAALFAVAWGTGFNQNVNVWSIALVTVWVVTMQVALLTTVRATAGRFVLWLATYLSDFFWIPFFGYLLLPSAFPSWRPTLYGGVSSMNRALAFMAVGTGVIVVGYVIGAVVTRPIGRSLERKYTAKPRRQRWLHLSPTWFFVCAM